MYNELLEGFVKKSWQKTGARADLLWITQA